MATSDGNQAEGYVWTHVDGMQVAGDVFSRLGTAQHERTTIDVADISVHVTYLSQHALVVVHGGGACKSRAPISHQSGSSNYSPRKVFTN